MCERQIIISPRSKNLSHNVKNALVKAVFVSTITILIYLIIVIITTPSLPPIAAINAAFKVNSIIIFGLAIGVGTQIFLSSYSKGLGCRIDKKKNGIFGAGTGSTAISSFLSFFSLVPLGCCGSWLLILSFLPSIFGSTLSIILIKYSVLLSYLGIAIVFGFTAISAIRLELELKQRRTRGEAEVGKGSIKNNIVNDSKYNNIDHLSKKYSDHAPRHKEDQI